MRVRFKTPWAALAILADFATAAAISVYVQPTFDASGNVISGADVAKAGFILTGAVIGAYITQIPRAISVEANPSAMLMVVGMLALFAVMSIWGAVAIYADSAFQGVAGMVGGGYGGALSEFFKRRAAKDAVAEEAAEQRSMVARSVEAE